MIESAKQKRFLDALEHDPTFAQKVKANPHPMGIDLSRLFPMLHRQFPKAIGQHAHLMGGY